MKILLDIYKFVKSYWGMKGLSHKDKLAFLRFGLRQESPLSCPDYQFISLGGSNSLRDSSAICLASSENVLLGSDEIEDFCEKNGFSFERELWHTIYRCYTKRHQAVFLRVVLPSEDLLAELEREEEEFFRPLIEGEFQSD